LFPLTPVVKVPTPVTDRLGLSQQCIRAAAPSPLQFSNGDFRPFQLPLGRLALLSLCPSPPPPWTFSFVPLSITANRGMRNANSHLFANFTFKETPSVPYLHPLIVLRLRRILPLLDTVLFPAKISHSGATFQPYLNTLLVFASFPAIFRPSHSSIFTASFLTLYPM